MEMTTNERKEIFVLIVDDQFLIRFLVSEIIEDFFQGRNAICKILSAKDGAEAMKIILDSNFPFDVLITDLNMPIMRGDELIAKARTVLPKTSFVMMTANESYIPSEELELTALLRKPFDEGLLCKILEPFLSNKG